MNNRSWLKLAFKRVMPPILLIALTCAVYLVYFIFTDIIHAIKLSDLYTRIISYTVKLIFLLSIFWIFVNIINISCESLYNTLIKNKSKLIFAIPIFNNGMKIILILVLLNIALPNFDIPQFYLSILQKIIDLILIVSIACIIIFIIRDFEKIVINQYQSQIYESLKSSRVYTQVKILKKILISIIIILGIAFSLMIFERGRELGASILASAGLLAAIVGLAAQRTLGNQLAGLQIVITQPIKINDAVIIENEFGNVEEITLSHVVIKLWDFRRFIVPINYFLEKPFQNLSRSSRDLLGIVLFYINYNFPIEIIRKEFERILNASILWDKKVGKLQVSDIKGNIIELRLLVSSTDSGKLWDLRCEIREKLIEFMRKNYPDELPKSRINV